MEMNVKIVLCLSKYHCRLKFNLYGYRVELTNRLAKKISSPHIWFHLHSALFFLHPAEPLKIYFDLHQNLKRGYHWLDWHQSI